MTDNVIQFVPGLKPTSMSVSSTQFHPHVDHRNAPDDAGKQNAIRQSGGSRTITPVGDYSDWYIAWPDTSSSEYTAPDGDCA